jgi:L-fucose isomerase
MYLITRDIMKELNAVVGGFMSQLEWGSDRRGLPLPVADTMESLMNSDFDHNGPKPVMPFATEADAQALLTMLFFTYLQEAIRHSLWISESLEPWEIQQMAAGLGIKIDPNERWAKRGFVDGNNSGSASFNWAGLPGASPEELLSNVSFPLADPEYFPGMGNSITFLTPGGIEGIAGRLAYSALSGLFSMVWVKL